MIFHQFTVFLGVIIQPPIRYISRVLVQADSKHYSFMTNLTTN